LEASENEFFTWLSAHLIETIGGWSVTRPHTFESIYQIIASNLLRANMTYGLGVDEFFWKADVTYVQDHDVFIDIRPRTTEGMTLVWNGDDLTIAGYAFNGQGRLRNLVNAGKFFETLGGSLPTLAAMSAEGHVASYLIFRMRSGKILLIPPEDVQDLLVFLKGV
jgi:hypothetical protein